MMLHDIIKIRLTDLGYLPNYPYHMISDAEMCNAFLSPSRDINQPVGTGLFFDYYPLLDTSDIELTVAYRQLVLSMEYYLLSMIYSKDNNFQLPDWIYSYMLGSAISVYSDKLDIHDLIYPLGVDNIDDDFDAASSKACLSASRSWINRTQESELIEADFSGNPALRQFDSMYIYGTPLSVIYASNQRIDFPEGAVMSRPPTMFGEPDIVKAIRISQVSLGR